MRIFRSGRRDRSGRLLLVNNRFCEFLGYSESELLSMRMRNICVAGDIAEADRLFKATAECGQSFEMESRLLRKDGTLSRWRAQFRRLRDKDGGFQQAAAIIVDITERKRAQDVERRLPAIIASSNDSIFGIDLGMKITSWNTGAERLYGYTADEVIGRSVLVLVPEDRQVRSPQFCARSAPA